MRLRIAIGVLVAALSPALGSADEQVQPPQLTAPQRGSLAGQLGGVAFETSDVRRGSFSLPSPFAVPEDRGSVQVQIFPTYSPDSGISEWGQGWRNDLAITRYRVSGTVDYRSDDLVSPWGQLRRGSDGYWYPLGLASRVRVEQKTDALYAYLDDGRVMTFGAAGQVQRPAGVYAWYLTEVDSAIGQRTTLRYDVNASGRPYLVQVSYGGRGDDFQYRVDLTYQAVPLLFFDFTSGAELGLDRRVQAVVVSAKSGATGQLETRWRYDLTYQDDSLGPAFYLSEVDQTFAAGDKAPPVRYGYALAGAAIADLMLRPVPKLDPILAAFGDDIVQPSASTPFDADQDGRVDLEEHIAQTLIHQRDGDFDYQALPANADAYAPCRFSPSTYNAPRTLAQMRGGDDDYQVVVLEPDAAGAQTELTVCDRGGTMLAGQSLDGTWRLDANTRLVDLDRDHAPDLVHVDYGWVSIVPNESDGTHFRFGAARGQTLEPAMFPTASWVHDFNGDGLPDLIARSSSLLTVWFGKGNLEFEPVGQTFDLRTAAGEAITDLDGYSLFFVDANHDGLTDLLLTRDYTFYVLVNNGYYLQQVVIPALDLLDYNYSAPVVADLAGSGNAELTFTRLGHAYALALDAPGTGLMSFADDGRGNVLRFGYARAPASAGVAQRTVVLASLDVESAGYDDTLHYDYEYGDPRLQSVGRFLLGFGLVARSGGTATTETVLANDDDVQGVVVSSTVRDSLQPAVVRRETHDYDRTSSFGIAWMRPKVEHRGWASPDGAASLDEATSWDAWSDEVCPARVAQTSATGTLTTETTYSHVAAFGKHLVCLAGDLVRTGRHADARIDFREEQLVERNDAGQVGKVTAVGGGGALVTQTAVYNADHTLASLTSAAEGTGTFGWDAGSMLLRQVTLSDGTVVRVAERDPHTDAIRSLATTHGALSWLQSFRFDGQERLARIWDNLGAAGDTNPDTSYVYRFAKSDQPSAVTTRQLVDAAAASGLTTVDFATAKGDPVTTARLFKSGWVFDPIVSRDRTHGQTTRAVRAGVAASVDVANLGRAALWSGLQTIGQDQSAAIGGAVGAMTKFHADVARSTRAALSIGAGALTRQEVVNDLFTTTRTLDASERAVRVVDEEGKPYAYEYDVLGRVRAVVLADGTSHRLDVDDFGRDRRVVRDGVATLDYTYEPATGRLQNVRWSSPAGQAIRQVTYAYDGAGRKLRESHQDLVSGATQTFTYYYDGSAPTSPADASTPGLLTAVAGDGFVKRISYRADGKPAVERVELTGWRTVETTYDYAENGEARGRTVVVRGADGAVLSSVALRQQYGSDGQVTALTLDGRPAATLTYDGNGEPATIALANGDNATRSYDPLTRAATGLSQRTSRWSTADALTRNARGFTGAEALTVGGQSVTRSYSYSPRGYLTASTDALASFGYDFDDVGLPTRIVDGGTERPLTRTGDLLTAGSAQYRFDAIGRTVARDDLQLAYGPDGHLRDAQRGEHHYGYRYDEGGRRLLKLVDGTPTLAYVGDAVLDAQGITIPVRLGGALVGVVRDGALTMLPLDQRGTTLGDADGSARLPSPFGDRATHPDWSAALDYVSKAYDADLGTVRMGVRDYDPRIGRFWTPDPLFLARPQECVRSAVECNLYGYARNAPVDNVDTDGRQTYAYEAVSEYAKSQMTPENRDQVTWAQVKIATMLIAAEVVPAKIWFAIGLGTLSTAQNDKDPNFFWGVMGIIGGWRTSTADAVNAARDAAGYQRAIAARDEVVRAFRLTQDKALIKDVATVVGAYNRDTGAIAVGTKFFDKQKLAFCGEDIAFAHAGADVDNVVLTPAIRPGMTPDKDRVIQPCAFCQLKFGDNFGFNLPALKMPDGQ